MGLDMQIPEGKCTVLMGRNGVGKTTLLQCIMGLVKVESGDIQYRVSRFWKTDAEDRVPAKESVMCRKVVRSSWCSRVRCSGKLVCRD